MRTMQKLMSRELAEDFYRWLDTLPEQDQHEAEQKIHHMLNGFPKLQQLAPGQIKWNGLLELCDLTS